jgi:hypothetical protein
MHNCEEVSSAANEASETGGDPGVGDAVELPAVDAAFLATGDSPYAWHAACKQHLCQLARNHAGYAAGALQWS